MFQGQTIWDPDILLLSYSYVVVYESISNESEFSNNAEMFCVFSYLYYIS